MSRRLSPHRATGRHPQSGVAAAGPLGALSIQGLDPWLDLRALSTYSGLSVWTLRALLRHPSHPLPHYRIGEPGGSQATRNGRRVRGPKILVRRSEFDRWMQGWRQREQSPPKDLDGILDQVIARVRNHR